MKVEFTPKLFSLLRDGITRETISRDMVSGVIVGIVALPLAIAFAIASGVSPEKGLVTAIIAGIVISAFGGSRVQIGGPTGAFIVIVYGIVQEFGLEGLTIATFLAGFIIIGLGLARLGNYLKFIPYSLIVGFTSAIALIILSTQINDFLGLGIKNVPSNFLEKWQVYIENFGSVNGYAIAIATGSVLLTIYFQKVAKKIPGSIIAIILSTLAVSLFDIPVETIESNFGEIPRNIAMPTIPSIDFDTIQKLIQPAFAIALLGGIESLLSAVVADSMIGGKHRSNMELIAQGSANILSALFGGIPATGAIARTATNVRNGGRTPIAGIVHGLVLLAIMLIFAPYAKLIPLSCLAGILMVVAYHMSEWRQFLSILKGTRMDIIILLTTFTLTVLFDLVIAIEIGVVLSSFLFMKRMSDSFHIQNIPAQGEAAEQLFESENLEIPHDVVLYEINGPLFFGAAKQFQETITQTHYHPKAVIIRMRYVPMIDATGFQSLKEIIKTYRQKGISVIISGVKKELEKDFEKFDLYATIDKEFVVQDIGLALDMAKRI